MEITTPLTILSSVIFLTFFVIYNKNILGGSVKPNIVTWTLFSLITLTNAITYFAFTNDIFKSALAATDCFTCIVITCLIVFKGQYSKVKMVEELIISITIISIVLWYIFHSAVYANLLLQPAYILAFIPTFKNFRNESALVWFAWAFSFILTIIVILMRWNDNWVDLVNPCLAFCLHGIVGFLALRKNNIKD